MDGDQACYTPWSLLSNHGKLWSYSCTGDLKCGGVTVCTTDHELGQGDCVRVALDLDWRPPRHYSGEPQNLSSGGAHGDSVSREFAGRGRVDFYKNGVLVGGLALQGWNGSDPLFAAACLRGLAFASLLLLMCVCVCAIYNVCMNIKCSCMHACDQAHVRTHTITHIHINHTHTHTLRSWRQRRVIAPRITPTAPRQDIRHNVPRDTQE